MSALNSATPSSSGESAPSSGGASHPPPEPQPTSEHIITFEGLTPGPRAQAFTTMYSRCLAQILKTVSYENFSSCFPTTSTNAPEVLRELWRQVMSQFEEMSNVQFEKIMEERNVVRSLNELDELIDKAKGRRKEGVVKGDEGIAPSMLPPEVIIAAHVSPIIHDATGKYEERLGGLQRENKELMRTIQEQRMEMEILEKQIEKLFNDLESTAREVLECVGEGAVGKLAGEMAWMEEMLVRR